MRNPAGLGLATLLVLLLYVASGPPLGRWLGGNLTWSASAPSFCAPVEYVYEKSSGLQWYDSLWQ